ncbi:hypothetical protein G6L14_10625 [Agrobacterium vitis]|uniref:hypothetical protein n=1 Tax=Agrobacterium vitis TaxID=373 RepID=UPI0015734F31|nr:hypothetical protein [Agrobacterium vitis]NSY12468.1 hypothetical protein [Agrobacterium vitis]
MSASGLLVCSIPVANMRLRFVRSPIASPGVPWAVWPDVLRVLGADEAQLARLSASVRREIGAAVCVVEDEIVTIIPVWVMMAIDEVYPGPLRDTPKWMVLAMQAAFPSLSAYQRIGIALSDSSASPTGEYENE